MVRNRIVRGAAMSILAGLLSGCAPSMDAQKRASIDKSQIGEVGGVEIAAFAKARTAVLLTGADEVTHLRIAKRNVQGVFRRSGTVCRTVGGCAAVPIDSRGYWLTARHCADSGAAMVYIPDADGTESAVTARIVWRGEHPGQDIAILYAPFSKGIIPVEVSNSIRMNARLFCVGSGIGADPFSAGRVVGVGGSTDGSLVWLEHDAPLTFGDSGGPAFYDDGLLAGINVEAGTTFSGDRFRATAILPSMAPIVRLIDDDWATMPTSHSRP